MSLGAGVAIAGVWLGIGMAFLGFGWQGVIEPEGTWSLLGVGFAVTVVLALLGPSRAT